MPLPHAITLTRPIEVQGKTLDGKIDGAAGAVDALKAELAALSAILPEASLKRLNAVATRLEDADRGTVDLALKAVDLILVDLLTGPGQFLSGPADSALRQAYPSVARV